MAKQRIDAFLLDALGTLLRLEPPAPRLRSELRERLGVEVSEARAARAVRAEIAFYRAHIGVASDRAGLAALRRRCAGVVVRELPELADRPVERVEEALLAAIRFAPYDEVPATLRELRARGKRLVVVSNWDVSLHDALAATGLDALVDGAVASAEVGAAKPDAAIFARGLEIAGATPERALHVGDTPEEDLAGALAAGIRPVLIVRDGAPPPGAIGSLDELLELAG